MAWTGRGRVAAVLCRANQLPVPQEVCVPPEMDVVACPAATLAERPLRTEQGRTPVRGLLASDKDPAPVANQTICRQPPEVRASCLNGHAGICAGDVG